MRIPLESEGSAAFIGRVANQIGQSDTHIYFDTSFLMWLTKIGKESRTQFRAWLQSTCADRHHVPIWSAHEYLRHHTAGTIAKDLTVRLQEVSSVARKTYAYLRPFLDDNFGEPPIEPEAARVEARRVLNGLSRVAGLAGMWKGQYPENARDVLTLINDRALAKTDIFNYLLTIDALADARYVGRIPPGFQDRGKKESSVNGAGTEEDVAATRIGSNRWGDLAFWKETLDHAKSVGARSAIILTNDRKNDWYFGDRDPKSIDDELRRLKGDWPAVPSPHPLLGFEAELYAGVERLILLDVPYLAALLTKLGTPDVAKFTDVALIPESGPITEKMERAEAIAKHQNHTQPQHADVSSPRTVHKYSDPSTIAFTDASLRTALYASRFAAPQSVADIVDQLHTTRRADRSVFEVLSFNVVQRLSQNDFVHLGRELHDRAVSEPGYLEALVDVLSVLEQLPPHMAGCIYLGFLASMYLEKEKNLARLPARSPAASALFAKQMPRYELPLRVLKRQIEKTEAWPIYIPSAELPKIEVSFATEVTDGENETLSSLRISGVELLTAVQSDQTLRLGPIFSGGEVRGDDLAAKACETYALPVTQLEMDENSERTFSFTTMTGFRAPDEVYLEREDEKSDDE